MKPYGFIITDSGRALIAGWSAGQISSSLAIAQIMVGSGSPNDGAGLESLYGLTELYAPLAQATSTVPQYDGDTIHMTVEYRSDLNGGLEQGFWLNEFGIYVQSTIDAGKKILFGYGTFGDSPQYVSAYSGGSQDVIRFPVSMAIGRGVDVSVLYDTAAFMTADNVAQYCNITMLPIFMANAEKLIKQHNSDPEAHPDIRVLLEGILGRLDIFEDMVLNSLTSNRFSANFNNLNGKTVEGVWNRTLERIEF